MKTPARRQQGFLMIAAVFLLVVLAGMITYFVTVSTTSQAASAADLNSARALQAARAGAEWGVFQILQNGGGTFKTNCDGGTTTNNVTFGGSTLAAFTARVKCTSTAYSESGTSARTYSIESNACNNAPCPNTTSPSTTYVERQVTVTVTSN